MQFQLDNRENLRQVKKKKHWDSCHANLLLIFHNVVELFLKDNFCFYFQIVKRAMAMESHAQKSLLVTVSAHKK